MKKSNRKPNPKTAARRAAMKANAERWAAMTPAERERYAGELIPTVTGSHLSPRNSFLVMLARSNASLVGGFKQWKQAGRKVRKGAEGIAILVPMTPGKGKGDEDSDEPTDAKPGKSRTFFGTGYVFDIADTEEIAESAEAAA